MREVYAEIVTRDVAVRFECPDCHAETVVPIDEFDPCGLWYGEEQVCCDECSARFNIVSVARDC